MLPGAGHEADRLTARRVRTLCVLEAVGEGGNRLGAAHGIHLVDSEQRTRSQDRGVGEAGEGPGVLALGRAGHGEGPDPGRLSRHHVHHDAGGVDRQAAGHVEAHAVDRHPALGDPATGNDLGGRVGAPLLGVDEPSAPDRLLERPPHLRVELLERGGEHLCGHAQRGGAHAVEALPELVEGLGPTMTHGLADRAHRRQCCLDVELGAGQDLPQLARGQHAAPKVDRGHHGSNSRRRGEPAPARSQ